MLKCRLTHLVKDMERPLAIGALDQPRFLKQICHYGCPCHHWGLPLGAKMEFGKFSKTGRVIVAQRFRISKSLENWSGIQHLCIIQSNDEQHLHLQIGIAFTPSGAPPHTRCRFGTMGVRQITETSFLFTRKNTNSSAEKSSHVHLPFAPARRDFQRHRLHKPMPRTA